MKLQILEIKRDTKSHGLASEKETINIENKERQSLTFTIISLGKMVLEVNLLSHMIDMRIQKMENILGCVKEDERHFRCNPTFRKHVHDT